MSSGLSIRGKDHVISITTKKEAAKKTGKGYVGRDRHRRTENRTDLRSSVKAGMIESPLCVWDTEGYRIKYKSGQAVTRRLLRLPPAVKY